MPPKYRVQHIWGTDEKTTLFARFYEEIPQLHIVFLSQTTLITAEQQINPELKFRCSVGELKKTPRIDLSSKTHVSLSH